MKKLIIGCLVVMLVGLTVPTASAAVIGECTNTGYTFMGGWMVYQTPPSSKDYFLTSNAPADEGSWGFGWVKFGDLPTEQVDEAWLSLECYKDMNGSLTSGNPMDVTIYAVDSDVANITADNVADFKETHIVGNAVASATLTGTGFYSWDITSTVNGWITGDNYGLVVIGWDDIPHPDYYTHPYFGGLPDGGSGASMAPTLATEPVPEPATLFLLVLLGTGLVLSSLRRRWRK